MTFRAFYTAVHGRPPFLWQEELAEIVLEGGWPAVIDLPTASGKTSVIDVAVWSLAQQSSTPDRQAPLRILYVIDRRIVVDSAAEHTGKIAKALENNTDLADLSERLLGFGGKRPLHVSVMRGGMYRDDTWVERPNQPTVCISTVDQAGSRLLFRGYGCSTSQRPVHAGLLGCDCLLILDEAHVSRPFLETVLAIQHRRTESFPFQICELSATPTRKSNLSLSMSDPSLRKRHRCAKPTRLVETADLVSDAARHATAMADESKVVGVVVNRVATARQIFERLRQRHEALLLTGRIRPYDRDLLLESYLPEIKAGRVRERQRPLFVVATQTIEVGADLDFDALVTESAAADALLQRFGRVNRLGELHSANGVALHVKGKEDPVYGAAREKTWRWLRRLAGPKRVVDFGVSSMKAHPIPEDCRTPSPSAPLLLRSYLDSWVQTRTVPLPDPDIAPFLHGDRVDLDVQLVWRADLDPDSPENWTEIVSYAPPTVREALPVSIGQAKQWLGDRPYLLWRGLESKVQASYRPGDTLVIPNTYGGCDEYGWVPTSTAPVSDIGDLAATRPRCRLHLKAHLKGRLRELWEADEQGEDTTGPKEEILREMELEGGEWRWYAGGAGAVVTKGVAVADDDDSASFAIAVTLDDHCEHVARQVMEFAKGCGLDQAFAEDLVLAAQVHDIGKADPRFQALLGAGPVPLAKSSSSHPLVDYRRICRDYDIERLPRHEFISVALMTQSSLLAKAHDRDLVLHLIGSHHGYRSVAPSIADTGVEVSARLNGELITTSSIHNLDRVDSPWIDQFQALEQRYGRWGLAYLEAILRRADCVASAEEQHG